MGLPVTTHVRSHKFPFNSCRNVHVLHKLSPNTNNTIYHHLELYQFILSFRHSPIFTSDKCLSIFPKLLLYSCSFPMWLIQKLSYDAIFKVFSHTFMLFWLTKASVTVKMSQLSFHVLFYLCLSSRDCFIFLVKVPTFYSCFCVILILVLCFST